LVPTDEALTHDGGFGAVQCIDEKSAIAELESELDGIGDSTLATFTYDDSVHDDVEVVRAGAVDGQLIAELDRFAVQASTDVALAAKTLELVPELALLAADNGGKQSDSGPLAAGQDCVDDLLNREGSKDLPRDRAVRCPHASVEQTQVVRDFRDCPHRGSRTFSEGPLLDRDGWTEAFDALDAGLGQLVQELPGVGRERLDVATLTLGVDGIEGERRLPGAARPGDHDQLVARQLAGDVLEVVLARAANDEPIHQVFAS
jgi:hypothetical protein